MTNYSPLVTIILMAFFSALLLLLACWYLLRLPSVLARRQRLAAQHLARHQRPTNSVKHPNPTDARLPRQARQEGSSPKVSAAPHPTSPNSGRAIFSSPSMPATPTSETLGRAGRTPRTASNPSANHPFSNQRGHTASGYSSFKQARQQSHKPSNDSFRGANASKTPIIKNQLPTAKARASDNQHPGNPHQAEQDPSNHG